MGQELLSLFQLETKRLLWLIGITFAVILVFQYFELPYSTTSGSSRFHPADPPSESEILNKVTYLDQANSTGEHALEIVNTTSTSEEKDNISGTDFISEPGKVSNKSLGFHESNESSMVDKIRISDNGSALNQAENLGLSSSNNTMVMNLTREANITSELEQKGNSSYVNSSSPSHAIAPTYLSPPVSPPTKVNPNITQSPPVVLNDSNEINSENDERPKYDVNMLGKNSSISSTPKENKDSHIPVPEVTSISDMSKLLLQSHATYRSMVYD